MKRRVAVVVTVVTVLVASVTTAVAVTVNDDENSFGHRDAMMSSRWQDRGDGPPRDWQPGRQGRGWMMHGPMHGSRVGSEYSYLAEMVAHHEEAVAAAQQLQRSERAAMREFGKSIVTSQSAQIEQMNRWLGDWYPDRSGQVEYQTMMRDLTGLSGDRLDRVFLQDMIWHHMAAVMMSQQLIVQGVADHGELEGLARDIRDEQHAEIFRMQRWLVDWFDAAWRHGPGMHRMWGF
jgi:uncharacterized protein (DUF305 family)